MSDMQRLDIERQVREARRMRSEALGELIATGLAALRRRALAALRRLQPGTGLAAGR